jgi:hypothetical protein
VVYLDKEGSLSAWPAPNARPWAKKLPTEATLLFNRFVRIVAARLGGLHATWPYVVVFLIALAI